MSEVRIGTTAGEDDLIADAHIDRLATRFQGTLLRPTDAAYDSARAVWNALVDNGPNYDRVRALKTKYDPTNLFRRNSNIKPASGR